MSASLSQTVDALNDDLFQGRAYDADAITFILSRQGLPGAYRGLFAFSDADRPLRLFTGETITTRAGGSHILGEECMRVLALCGAIESEGFRRAQRAAHLFLGEKITGRYCCATCSAALLRASAAGAYDKREERIRAGIERIHESRQSGRWRRYPFYYTLLALSECGPAADAELAYARPACERALRSSRGDDIYSARRNRLLTRLLATRPK